MSYKEKSYLSEEERKKQEKSEKEQKKEQEKILAFEKKKQEIREEEETHNDLQKLRDLLEEHIIDDALVEKVLSWDEINHEEMKEIFEKIDEIENMEDIDEYVPQDMRISKDEYAWALHNEEDYKLVLWKLHNVLQILSRHVTPQTSGSINIFSGFITLLDKNLIRIQEHHIDMKNTLESSSWKEGKQESIWEILKKYFR